jgi:hypothetical protein
VIGEVPAAAASYLKSKVPVVDLTSIGFEFDGAGTCVIPGGKTLHLLYQSRDEPHRHVSLFVQRYENQITIEPGKLAVLEGPEGHTVLAWRGDTLVFYLVAGDASDADKAAGAYGQRRSAS